VKVFSWERVWCGGVIMLECVCCGWQLLVKHGLMYVQSGYRWWVVGRVLCGGSMCICGSVNEEFLWNKTVQNGARNMLS